MFKRVLIIVSGILGCLALTGLLAVLGFYFWAQETPAPMPQAIEALESDDAITVTVERDLYVFESSGSVSTAGYIFYPGGRVDPRSYAPYARAIAEAGYLVVIPEVQFNIALFDVDVANEVIADFPQIEQWVVGGHSIGGVAAAEYAVANPVNGLVLLASYPNSDLSNVTFPIVSVYGTLDGLITQMDIDNSRALLPDSTKFVEIEGGNHAGFGWYGPQANDNEAEIAREEQMQQSVNVTLELLSGLNDAGS